MTLKILSMNIHKGFSIFDRNFTLPLLKMALLESDADIVFLQEVVGENLLLQKKIKDWPALQQSEYLAGEKWPYHVYGKNALYHQRHHGNAILSRHPIDFSENISISNYRLEQRGLLHCSVKIPTIENPVHLFNVHLDLTQRSREKQIQKIINRARSHVPDRCPLILAGDFNDWSRQASKPLHESLLLKDAAKNYHGEYSKSFPSFMPVLTLDRIYYRTFNVLKVLTWDHHPWPSLSDHLPLYAELEL